MGLFDRDYDRDYGYRGRDRDMGDRMRAGWNRMRSEGTYGPYDRDYGYRNEPRMWGGRERTYGNRGFDEDTYRGGWAADRGYGYTGASGGYDRNYKSRWETDYGDPFGDRTSRTPMRVMRGEFDRNMGYDRDYSSSPMGYDPYYNREGTWNRGGRYNNRGYDNGWF